MVPSKVAPLACMVVKNGTKINLNFFLPIFALNRDSALSRGKIETWPFLFFLIPWVIAFSTKNRKSIRTKLKAWEPYEVKLTCVEHRRFSITNYTYEINSKV